jgi:capsular exopolysaccharide synthesis family protein
VLGRFFEDERYRHNPRGSTDVQQGPEALNLKQTLDILRSRALLIILCAVVVAAAAFGFSKLQTKKYTATASLAFNLSSLSQEIAGLPSISSSSSLLAQQASNLEAVRLGNMAAETAAAVGHGLTAQKVGDDISVAGQGESGVVDIVASSSSPALAAEIANTYAERFVKTQQGTNQRYLKSALALVRKQLAALSRQQRVGSDGLELQDRAQTLALLSELQYDDVQLAAEASAPTSPSSPKTKRNALLGGLLGLLIGLGFAFLLERLDGRIKDPEDLEAIYRIPLLGAVPESTALSASSRGKGRRAALPPAEAEAFSLVRAHLRFFNVDRDLRTIVIVSAEPGDGKTTVARHLAEAAARLGSRVLLLEADLRHPTLAAQFDIEPGPGLTDVLIGRTLLHEAAQSVRLDAPAGEGIVGRTLDVLVAGSVPPPNPGELLESQAMQRTLEQARSSYGLVLVDTPPLTVVSDAFPLLCKVDGVVVVGWPGRSRRDAAQSLQQIFSSSAAPMLGVVVNGSSPSGPTSSYIDAGGGKRSSGSPPLAPTNGASTSSDAFARTVNKA